MIEFVARRSWLLSADSMSTERLVVWKSRWMASNTPLSVLACATSELNLAMVSMSARRWAVFSVSWILVMAVAIWLLKLIYGWIFAASNGVFSCVPISRTAETLSSYLIGIRAMLKIWNWRMNLTRLYG